MTKTSKQVDLPGLYGLGSKSAEWLRTAGIISDEDLRRWGSVAADVKVKLSGRPVRLNLPSALEAVLTGEPWRVAGNSRKSAAFP